MLKGKVQLKASASVVLSPSRGVPGDIHMWGYPQQKQKEWAVVTSDDAPRLRRCSGCWAFALGHPSFGPGRIAAELRRAKWGGVRLSPNGVWRCGGATGSTPGQAPGPRGRLQRPPLDERPPAQCWKPALARHLLTRADRSA